MIYKEALLLLDYHSTESALKMTKMTTFQLFFMTLVIHQATSCSVLDILSGQRCIQVSNNCDKELWPVVRGVMGNGVTNDTGFLLLRRTSRNVMVPANWTYIQVWSREACDNSWICYSGNCGSENCISGQGSSLPVTLGEIWLGGLLVPDKYRVNLFTGFNVPMNITTTLLSDPKLQEDDSGKSEDNLLQKNSLSFCETAGQCKVDLATPTECPSDLWFKNNHGFTVACMHPCQKYNTSETCCRDPYNTSTTCLSSLNSIANKIRFHYACPAGMFTPFDDFTFSCNFALKRVFNVDLCP